MEKQGSKWGKRPTDKSTAPPVDPEALDQFVTGVKPKGKATSEEPKVRLNVLIPESLHQRVKVACATEKTSMTDVVIEFLEKRFSKQ